MLAIFTQISNTEEKKKFSSLREKPNSLKGNKKLTLSLWWNFQGDESTSFACLPSQRPEAALNLPRQQGRGKREEKKVKNLKISCRNPGVFSRGISAGVAMITLQ